MNLEAVYVMYISFDVYIIVSTQSHACYLPYHKALALPAGIASPLHRLAHMSIYSIMCVLTHISDLIHSTCTHMATTAED